ncbi:MAG: hypothetical protein WC496_03565 [Phycisphaerae bacterium]|jgi:hypothetical protein
MKNSFEYIEKLINENNVEKALDILNHNPDRSIWFQNARAVCLMRLNSPGNAVKTLTSIVYPNSFVMINPDAPDKIKLNMAEAMLLTGNVAGAVKLIENSPQDCPLRNKLETAIKKWKLSLPFWSRLAITLFGTLPYDRPIAVERPYGVI